MKSNFEFLKRYWPALSQIGAAAESYVYSDPNACLYKLGMFGERLILEIFAFEHLQCLDLLWRELENHYSQKDVCIPILGAGITSFDGGSGASVSQQDLLDMMIWSYKLSSHKIKAPHRLRIVCKKNSGFTINNIDK